MLSAAPATAAWPPFPARAAVSQSTVDARYAGGARGHLCLPYAVTHHGAALLTKRFRTAGSPSLATSCGMTMADRYRIILAGIDLVRETSSAALDVLEASNATVDAGNAHDDLPLCTCSGQESTSKDCDKDLLCSNKP
eukprot:Skav208784  [mRNA]  locus=scaffold3559:160587:161000:+ [translate_table: standard]